MQAPTPVLARCSRKQIRALDRVCGATRRRIGLQAQASTAPLCFVVRDRECRRLHRLLASPHHSLAAQGRRHRCGGENRALKLDRVLGRAHGQRRQYRRRRAQRPHQVDARTAQALDHLRRARGGGELCRDRTRGERRGAAYRRRAVSSGVQSLHAGACRFASGPHSRSAQRRDGGVPSRSVRPLDWGLAA